MPRRSDEYMAQKRLEFCEAALECFRRQGVAATSLADICEETGLTIGAIYRHFDSRDTLMGAVLDLLIARFSGTLNQADWGAMRTATLEMYRKYGVESFRHEFFGHVDWIKGLRERRICAALDLQDLLEERLSAFHQAGEISPPLGMRQTAQLLAVIMDGVMIGTRDARELRVSEKDLITYFDLVVGAKI